MVLVIIASVPLHTASAEVFTVTTSADGTAAGTLRWALTQSNQTQGLDTVAFAVPGTGPHTIQPTSPLPTLTDPVLIDGCSQPGASPATEAAPAIMMIELDGSQAGPGASGLQISGGATTVR
ncbi:MAG: hypothetical protein MUE60_08690, partial [Candidatus Eisenbacteria bacterium]|nr:hypothetical protein [Candidatus Eisenbacteria bacterium]